MRAILEGVAYSLPDCYGLIEEMKLPVKRIFLIGGGARSLLWSSIVCDDKQIHDALAGIYGRR